MKLEAICLKNTEDVVVEEDGTKEKRHVIGGETQTASGMFCGTLEDCSQKPQLKKET